MNLTVTRVSKVYTKKEDAFVSGLGTTWLQGGV